MVQRYEQTRKLQWYKRGAAYILLIRGIREFLFTFSLLRFLCFQLNLICV